MSEGRKVGSIAQTDHWFVFWVEKPPTSHAVPRYAMVRDDGQSPLEAARTAVDRPDEASDVRVGRIRGIVEVKLNE